MMRLWLLFALIVVCLVFVPVLFAQTVPIQCEDYVCTISQDHLIKLVQYIQHLEAALRGSCA